MALQVHAPLRASAHAGGLRSAASDVDSGQLAWSPFAPLDLHVAANGRQHAHTQRTVTGAMAAFVHAAPFVPAQAVPAQPVSDSVTQAAQARSRLAAAPGFASLCHYEQRSVELVLSMLDDIFAEL